MSQTVPNADRDSLQDAPPRSRRGDPVWELAQLYPRQGDWTVEDYLSLDCNRLVEFDGGILEFLPMPSAGHQLILGMLSQLFRTWATSAKRPPPLFAPLPVRVRPDRYREPDLLLPRQPPDPQDRHVESPELVLEIVSVDPKSRRRDLVEKRRDYAAAGIPEYWIVDPETETITVLTLPAGATEYAVHGEFRPGQTAASALLPGFAVDVAACFAAGKGTP